MDQRNSTQPPSNAGKNARENWRIKNKNIQTESGHGRNNRYPHRYRNDNPVQPYQKNKYDGTNRRPNNKDQYNTRYFNFNRLHQLSKMDSDDVIIVLAKKKTEFEELLNDINTPDLMVVTLRVLTTVCRANFTEIVTSVLSHACSPVFLKSLEAYLTKLPFETLTENIKNKLYHDDKDKFWCNLIEFFKKVTELLPHTARDELLSILRKINPIIASIETSKGYEIDEKVKDDVLMMSQDLEQQIRKIEEKNKKSETSSKEPDVDETPPEDFRTLSIIPTVEDLFNQKPYIRPCKIKDAYDSVEHYLDVQFRLLREDFVGPLRSGIEEYLHGTTKHRNHDLRVYKKVTLIAPDVAKNHVGIMISFGVLKYVNWKNSKRFIYGGLLLLSNDNFNTILFATVMNRDEKELEKGLVMIEPCAGTNITRDMYNVNFVMLESKIYFQPYSVVLNAMKALNELNFPMKNYLINADTSVSLPRYLNDNDLLKYKKFNLPVGKHQFWPTATDLNLDETQYNAFKSALTQEFAVIQGPPGTGKTFIALKIVETLLENGRHWFNDGPIVVVCLTNHALDQFLEGILRYTDSIVRIGSRSKSEILKPHTLMERRKKCHFTRQTDAWPIMCGLKDELEKVLQVIQKLRLSVRFLTTPDAIVPLRFLKEFSNCPQLNKFQTNEELVNWLVGFNLTLIREVSSLPQQSENLNEEQSEDDSSEYMDDELEFTYKFQVNDSDKPIFILQSISALIAKLLGEVLQFRSLPEEYQALPFDPTFKWEEDIKMLYEQQVSLQRNLSTHPLLNTQRFPVRNPRWRLYWRWITSSYETAMNRITKMEERFRIISLQLEESKQLVDLSVLRQHKIIGLTTNAAARQNTSLCALHAPIVLVEEAAEILEAHVVCSLTRYCKHVILIGDHKQLRPKASVYQLGKKYNLNISLFERMVNIRGECTQLAHQHRMRPQIAKLITPSIYDTLYNHESVLNYPAVKGLVKNLFFLNHNNPETSHNNEESWVNVHEAKFLVAFARHLILQGYDATELTIVCTYTGQLFAFKKETDRYPILRHVRVTTIDNYQGEENRVILLSLVRNNGEGNIGFLKEENRVCVALSRAREGLYVMGNMDDLVVKNEIWPKIKKVLEEENSIGDFLELKCEIHSDQLIRVRNASDFQQCPEGGCMKQCNADLPCGHTCTSICHISDREHVEFQCKEPCVKSCPYDHPCPSKCWESCKPCRVSVERQLKCGHTVKMPCLADVDSFRCYIEVEAVLPHCNHTVKKPCGDPVETWKCPYPCEDRLPCGHSCIRTCHFTEDPDHIEYRCYKDCTKNNVNCMNNHPCKKRCFEICVPCPIIVGRLRSCGHYYKSVQCSKDVEKIECKRKCNREMDCGHICKQKCFESCGNCQEIVMKKSPCGHMLKIKCCEVAARFKCNDKCQRILICGHKCTTKCNEPCTLNCKAMVKQTKPGLCGHIFSVPCHLIEKNESNPQELLKYCKEPCKTQLDCGHLCKGRCGSCKQGRIHAPCAEPCGNILICGHKCDIPCRQECQPCERICEVQCKHSKCRKRCGMPCVQCKEMCAWGCEHRRCLKRCFELCDIEPCNEPCTKKLKCQHPCVGFCGDPCPPLCRICNTEELTEIVFGDEDEPDARFVYLVDCHHCIESNALSKWISSKSDKSIQMKTCPRCTTPIKKCMRIMNQIKKDLRDVLLVKKKIFGNQANLKNQQTDCLRTIEQMLMEPIVKEFQEWENLLKKLRDKGIHVKNQKRQILSMPEVEALKTVLKILREMIDVMAPIKTRRNNFYQHVKNQVLMLLESIPTRGQMSNQEIVDIMLEVKRLNYMATVCNIEGQYISDGIVNTLVSIERFSDEKAVEVRKELSFSQAMFNDVRQMIRKAMGFSQGHWFKCPNGHIYAIGECGGATEESKCNECGAVIGGRSHRLTSGNTLAREMDGATRSAWPGAV